MKRDNIMKLFAIYDPHWGDPVIIPETLRNSEEDAWTALASMTPPHSAHVSLGQKHLLSQGYEAHPVRILKGEGFSLNKEVGEQSRRLAAKQLKSRKPSALTPTSQKSKSKN
jgi:hypothetical protein